MLDGEYVPPPMVCRIADVVLFVACLIPWLAIAGAMILVCVMALVLRRDLPEFWILLRAGSALLIVIGGLIYWLFWRWPQLTISRFEYDGFEFIFESPARGRVSRAAGELRSVVEARSRGSGWSGWWLKFESVGWVFLSRSTSNADRLMHQLGRFAGSKHSQLAPPYDPFE